MKQNGASNNEQSKFSSPEDSWINVTPI